ncbi:acyl-CoA dehydratase activase [Johnsonella ignava]|jgi:CoA-substrate-specific enzyme activase, putative|uniref:acyl-CoA dehydratase activase n=1 Tax=Johnsonella ignava TaxID=43995 RepID=UPI0023F0D845|nr:acyl-CoA dehydratase activase [Johnsonella ignava]
MDYNYFAGVDIGSTASKVAVIDDEKLLECFNLPTGWNSKETAKAIYKILEEKGYTDSMRCVATGYGRICVEYADKIITEITCHGRGAFALFGADCTVIDVGGQDTKIISLEDGNVRDFLMNDKCAAGTGKFIEIMANRLGATFDELYDMAKEGNALSISSMCTVFAESEVISHIGAGEKREDIAAGVIDSVADRVANLCKRHGFMNRVFLTGGLCSTDYFVELLSQKLGKDIQTHKLGRYAGALGAALSSASKKEIIISEEIKSNIN